MLSYIGEMIGNVIQKKKNKHTKSENLIHWRWIEMKECHFVTALGLTQWRFCPVKEK